MSTTLPWYVARASGLVDYLLVTVTVLLGTALAARALRRRPGLPWVNGMHEWLGVLTLTFVAVHVLAILADGCVGLSLTEMLVPLASHWNPAGVAWGTVSLYLLAAAWLVAYFRRRLPTRVRPLWKRVHLLAYPAFGATTVHLLTTGTDRGLLPVLLAVAAAVTSVAWTAGSLRLGAVGKPTAA